MEMEIGEGGEKKKVMVFVDETEDSCYALMWVLDNLHQSLLSQDLVIFTVEPPANYNSVFAAPASLSSARLYCSASTTPGLLNSFQAQEKKVALGLLEKAKTICTSRGINAEAISIVGDPKEAICSAVEMHSINLLVLAEQSIGRIKGTFKWSLSDYCVHYAKCPVLVIKKPK